jgi:dipeptidyl-peptidase-3
LSGISRQEIDSVGAIAAHMNIDPENTRLFKSESQTGIIVDILQASVEKDIAENVLHDKDGLKVLLVRGDFSDVLQRICENLEQASVHTNDEKKKDYISQLCASFRTGNMEQYKESQRTWVRDHQTTISTVFGFVEPYRDPCGVRAEFEGIVGIEHPGETAMLRRLRDNAGTFIKRLPWVDKDHDDDSFGAFEVNMVDGLHFVSVESMVVRPA